MKNLGWFTVLFTYLLMVWGNLVSSTGSGLACPDWPLCHGTILPSPSTAVVLEWGHRLLAATTTLLIFALVVKILRAAQPPQSALKRSGRTLLVLLGTQILLGATTVLLGLSVTVSTIHLLVATFVFSGLITVACVITWENPVVDHPSAKIQRLGLAGLAGLLIQFALGGLVRHAHAGLACPNFPNCLESFFPVPFTFETAIAFIHRWWGILLLGIFVHLALEARKTTPALGRAARFALGLAVAQIVLGIGTVMSGLNTHSRATHAAVGYALWGTLFYLTIRAGQLRWLWNRARA